MISNLPLNSFKRDEIYTFFGGAYVAATWSIYYSISAPLFPGDSPEWIFWLWFACFWFISTALMFLIGYASNSLFGIIVNKLYRNEEKHKLLDKLGIDPGTDVFFIFDSKYMDLINTSHISQLVFICFMLTGYPIVKILNPHWALIIFSVLLLIYCLFFSFRTVFQLVIFNILKIKQGIEFVDTSTYQTELAMHFAKRRAEVIGLCQKHVE